MFDESCTANSRPETAIYKQPSAYSIFWHRYQLPIPVEDEVRRKQQRTKGLGAEGSTLLVDKKTAFSNADVLSHEFVIHTVA